MYHAFRVRWFDTISLFEARPLTKGFAQSGRREKNSAIYRYSNSVGGDPVSESTFCYKLYSVFLMGIVRAGQYLSPPPAAKPYR